VQPPGTDHELSGGRSTDAARFPLPSTGETLSASLWGRLDVAVNAQADGEIVAAIQLHEGFEDLRVAVFGRFVRLDVLLGELLANLHDPSPEFPIAESPRRDIGALRQSQLCDIGFIHVQASIPSPRMKCSKPVFRRREGQGSKCR